VKLEKKLWTLDHYEQNEDHKTINDNGYWTAGTVGDKQLLHCCTNGNEVTSVQVTGDLLKAKELLKAQSDSRPQWPSLLLGPQCAGDWDELLEGLGLTRIGEPTNSW
jgi:hypothetical protein